MKKYVLVSDRGQITLPASLRKRLGIEPGGVVVLEERAGEVVLKPAVAVALETYSKKDIARWETEDELSDAERSRIKGLNREGNVVLRKAGKRTGARRDRFEAVRGTADVKWRTEVVMTLLRDRD